MRGLDEWVLTNATPPWKVQSSGRNVIPTHSLVGYQPLKGLWSHIPRILPVAFSGLQCMCTENHWSNFVSPYIELNEECQGGRIWMCQCPLPIVFHSFAIPEKMLPEEDITWNETFYHILWPVCIKKHICSTNTKFYSLEETSVHSLQTWEHENVC